MVDGCYQVFMCPWEAAIHWASGSCILEEGFVCWVVFMLGSGHMQLCNELFYLLCVGVILGCWACTGRMLVIPIIAQGHLRLGDGTFVTALSSFSLLLL